MNSTVYDQSIIKKVSTNSRKKTELSQISQSFECQIQVRYHQEISNCTVNILSNGTAEIIFEKPMKTVAVGQSAVFYDGEVLLGGGIIDRVLE